MDNAANNNNSNNIICNNMYNHRQIESKSTEKIHLYDVMVGKFVHHPKYQPENFIKHRNETTMTRYNSTYMTHQKQATELQALNIYAHIRKMTVVVLCVISETEYKWPQNTQNFQHQAHTRACARYVPQFHQYAYIEIMYIKRSSSVRFIQKFNVVSLLFYTWIRWGCDIITALRLQLQFSPLMNWWYTFTSLDFVAAVSINGEKKSFPYLHFNNV